MIDLNNWIAKLQSEIEDLEVEIAVKQALLTGKKAELASLEDWVESNNKELSLAIDQVQDNSKNRLWDEVFNLLPVEYDSTVTFIRIQEYIESKCKFTHDKKTNESINNKIGIILADYHRNNAEQSRDVLIELLQFISEREK